MAGWLQRRRIGAKADRRSGLSAVGFQVRGRGSIRRRFLFPQILHKAAQSLLRKFL